MRVISAARAQASFAVCRQVAVTTFLDDGACRREAEAEILRRGLE